MTTLLCKLLSRAPCHIVFLSAMLLTVDVGWAQHAKKHKTNDEQAQELLNDKKHSFEDLLKGGPEAVAAMKRIFELTTDSNLKQRAASLLVFLKVKEPVYFDYLTQQATQALDNDMPWPTLYDKDGEKITKHVRDMNPSFLKWCDAHHLDPSDQFYNAYYRIPLPWYHLAATGDPRAYPLFIQGLHSPNPMIVTAAAYGLARLHDSRAVGELIETARRSPSETRYNLIEVLLTFSDEKAQATAEELASNKKLLAELRAMVKKPDYKLAFNF